MEAVQRVMLYRLTEDQRWEEVGIGDCQVQGHKVELLGHEDRRLPTFLIEEAVATSREGSFIYWTDRDNLSYALSFLTEQSADLVWKQISESLIREPVELPEPTPANLECIIKLLTDPLFFCEDLLNSLSSPEFLDELKVQFADACEKKLSNLNEYTTLYKILLQTNNESLINQLLDTSHYLHCFGALELELPGLNYTETLKSAKFVNVLDIPDDSLLEKLHLAYRLKFLTQTYTCRTLSEPTIAFLSTYLASVWAEIAQFFTSSRILQLALAEKLQDNDSGAWKFLKELLQLTRTAAGTIRVQVYKAMLELEVVETASLYWDSFNDLVLKAELVDMVAVMLREYPETSRVCLLRDLALSEEPFLILICTEALITEDLCLLKSMTSLFRVLVMEEALGTGELHSIVYDQFLLVAFETMCAGSVPDHFWFNEVIDLLVFCIEQSPYTVIPFVLMSNVIPNILRAADTKSRILVTMKLVRAILMRKDPSLCQVLAKSTAFELVLKHSDGGMLESGALAIAQIVRDSKELHSYFEGQSVWDQVKSLA